ncbi:MAG TPA: YkgJ family cysteine cluster protein [Usitatibacter sp.]|nr:YkgJ family cysteine cluster protein [Usitatibacter sp.]
MSATADTLAEARRALADARDAQALPQAVVRFHRKVDEVIAESIKGHAVEVACKRGCGYCCHMQVEILPPEGFALAAWLRRSFDAARLAAVIERLRANAARTRELGLEGRKRANLPCALLGDDGACSAYEARPAQCRRFHSTNLATCLGSHAAPDDDSIESPAHPLVSHNAQVIVTVAQHGMRDAGLDATPLDMNYALLEALENPSAQRRWRDGKKAFVNASRLARVFIPALWAAAVLTDFD